MRLGHLLASVWKNYSLLRAYENDFVKELKLSGRGIDLGAKSTDAKYYEYLDLSSVEHMDFVDFFHTGDGVIKMDLEKPFPIEDESYDFILSFNVMEHIYNYSGFVSEINRALKNEGELHLLVPFLWHYHPDPHDYFRYSCESLKVIMQQAGFRQIKVVPLAAGPFKVSASMVAKLFKIRPLIFILYALGVLFDFFLSKSSKGLNRYPLGYYVNAVK